MRETKNRSESLTPDELKLTRCFHQRWASRSIFKFMISDIQHQHLVFRYRTKYVEQNPLIQMEESQYQHQSPC
jgi:hypothetical protein